MSNPTTPELVNPDGTVPAEPVHEVSGAAAFWLILTLTLSFFGTTMALATPQSISLALKLNEISPETATTDLGSLIGVGLAIQILALILVGRLSDYTTSRFGMRRPWLIGGAVAVAIGSLVLAVSSNLPMLWIGFMILGVGATACASCLYATIPEQVPERHRGLTTGFVAAGSGLGTLAGLLIVTLAPGNLFLVFVLPAIAAIVPVIVFAVLLRDRRLLTRPKITWALLFGSFTINRKNPNVAWFLPSIILMNSVLAVSSTYSYYIFGYQYGVAPEDIPAMAFLNGVIAGVLGAVASLVVGPLSDKVGRRKPFYIAAVVFFIAGALTVALSHDLVAAFVGFALITIGSGAVGGTYLAITMEGMTTLDTAARDINVVVAGYSLAFVFMPLLAPVFLGVAGDNFPALLIAGAVLTALSVVSLLKVKVR